jgi:hypothetical protein
MVGHQGAFALSSPYGGLLSPREVSTFLDYSLAISVMRGSTEDEIDDVFARINTYGHRLSDQERRPSRSPGRVLESCQTAGV